MTLIYDGINHPVEIAPGRGDLRYSSSPASMALGTPGGLRTATVLAGGRQVSYAELYATQPYVAACVGRMLQSSIRVPLKLYRRTGDDSRVRLGPKDHPLAAALQTPWDRGSQADLTMSFLGPLLVHGNGISPIDNGARNKIRFQVSDWRFARPITPWRDSIAGWDLDVDDESIRRTVGADTVLHLKYWSPYGPIGVSPLQQLGTTIAIEDAAQRHQKAMLANGARPPSAVKASEAFLSSLSPDERAELLDDLREDIDFIYSGPENNGRPALLPPGLDWVTVGHSAVEAELIDQRKLTREETCGVYQMPPPMVGVLDRATFNNIEILRQMLYSDCLAPPLVLSEQSINSQVITALLREDDIYVEYDFAGVLRGNRLQEVQALREAVATALLTPNEARTIDNRPTSNQPGMDQFYLPGNNLKPVGSTADGGGDQTSSDGSGSSTDNSSAGAAAQTEPAPVGA